MHQTAADGKIVAKVVYDNSRTMGEEVPPRELMKSKRLGPEETTDKEKKES